MGVSDKIVAKLHFRRNVIENTDVRMVFYWKSLNIVDKHVFICSNHYIYTTVVQEVYNRGRSPVVDDVEGLAAAATKHLELRKQKG